MSPGGGPRAAFQRTPYRTLHPGCAGDKSRQRAVRSPAARCCGLRVNACWSAHGYRLRTDPPRALRSARAMRACRAHEAGAPDSPHSAPASRPVTAPTVSASLPRLAARIRASAIVSLLSTHHSGRLQRMQHVSRGGDVVARFPAPRTRRHRGDPRIAVPVPAAQDGFFRRPGHCLDQQFGEQCAGLYRLRRSVRGAALQPGGVHRLFPIVPPTDRHG